MIPVAVGMMLMGLAVGFVGGVFYARWYWLGSALTSRREIISLQSPCPACGNRGCELAYAEEEQLVRRRCKHCGCVVQQPPVAPDLFRKKTP